MLPPTSLRKKRCTGEYPAATSTGRLLRSCVARLLGLPGKGILEHWAVSLYRSLTACNIDVMIAKHVPMQSVAKSNFASLVAYLCDTQRKEERLGWTATERLRPIE